MKEILVPNAQNYFDCDLKKRRAIVCTLFDCSNVENCGDCIMNDDNFFLAWERSAAEKYFVRDSEK